MTRLVEAELSQPTIALPQHFPREYVLRRESDAAMNTDARVTFHSPYTAVTPAMAKPSPGVGSDYRIAFLDAASKPFDGSKTYKVTMPPNPPGANFWAFTLYDTQTRSMLQTDQPLPSIDSIQNDPKLNDNGSIDVFFALEAPEGWESNWVQTIPGKSWFTILRMYGPEEEWLNGDYVPGEITLVEYFRQHDLRFGHPVNFDLRRVGVTGRSRQDGGLDVSAEFMMAIPILVWSLRPAFECPTPFLLASFRG
ncbi:DUF1214 domain-containing protein [Tropicimonas sp. TH_r6]|uniref:DUF1214 domain-containing protein n=1 Tax=Tropicimonas sp. TH_r6 TaxID=3082085 RepID=UPI002953E7F0|nr:DUF1214 domain-containing protein [Tropicimonas sp. TH_r6]MDV7142132.1 DUF1214 domain-containing protein [Tropicimonas sp. TH_r6]